MAAGSPQAPRSPNWQCGRRRRSSAGQLRPPDRHARSRASRPARPEATYRNGRRPDFAKKPLVSLLAFCFAFGDGPYRVTLALTQTRACRCPRTRHLDRGSRCPPVRLGSAWFRRMVRPSGTRGTGSTLSGQADLYDEPRARVSSWPPLRPTRLRCERGSVVVALPTAPNQSKERSRGCDV
jgi:hypothetical protein